MSLFPPWYIELYQRKQLEGENKNTIVIENNEEEEEEWVDVDEQE